MRLLKVAERGELSLTPDLHKDIPPYAILSHTWGKDGEEVILDEIKDGSGASKVGYTKIRFCADQARKDGLQYFWVDTCCIDKKNQSELAEAIVSMFRWYAEATRCYVFLSDVSSRKRDSTGSTHCWESGFRESKWFKRGWTLQELLAPNLVEFYSREGERLGDKQSLERMIHEVTEIPPAALRGTPLSQFSADERMQWALRRRTTRSEDRAYCLLGIFDVSMPPIYGEGDNAFVRLKDEIAKSYRRQLERIGQDTVASKSLYHDTPSAGLVRSHTVEISLLDRRKVRMTSLGFEQMDSRRSTIKNAYSTTCRWLLQHPAYTAWLDPEQLDHHRGFLWINGKPGAGKSTLIKFAHARAQSEKAEQEILLSYFFNARGEELEKSTVGMYRALLFQLLSQAVDMQELLDNLSQSSKSLVEDYSWTLEELCELLSASIGRLGKRRVKCFVDALDECDEQQVQEMIILFEELGRIAVANGTELYVCFASRHFPVIVIRHGRQLILEDEHGHSEDLAMYVQRHLRAGKAKDVEDIKLEIRRKSNGVFLWAVLVVGILNKEFKSGRVWAVKKRLQEIPPGLSDLFKDILRRDCADMDEFLLCLQWILFAKQPLRREEFYYAMLSGLEPDSEELTVWNPDRITEDDMARFVLTSSKGFAELTKSKTPTVQFIHESVRDFLVKDKGLSELWPHLGEELHSLSHDRLKRCCWSYLKVDMSGHITPIQKGHKASSENAKSLRNSLTSRFPFLEYASHNVFYHSNEAATAILQDDFLADFPLVTWIELTNLLERFENRRHTLNASLLYILAENNSARLIRTLCRSGPGIGVRGERYHYPLLAALVNGHQDAVRALLHLQGVDSPVLREGVDIQALRRSVSYKGVGSSLIWALEVVHDTVAEILIKSVDFFADTGDAGRNNTLSRAAKMGHTRIVSFLMAADGFQISWGHDFAATLLHDAASEGHSGVVQLLLDKGVDVDTSCPPVGDTALAIAARTGKDSIVQLLLSKGANINTKDCFGSTALNTAARYCNASTVQKLLERNVDLEAADSWGETALIRAADRGDAAIVKLLLDKGANVNAINHNGKTALLNAAWGYSSFVIQPLLARGADIEHADSDGRTALMLAAGSLIPTRSLQILLDHGANIDAVDNNGKTPLHYAASRSNSEACGLLLERNANVHAVDKQGKTPLHYAASNGSTEPCRLLLERNANVHAVDKEGKTALHCAAATASIPFMLRSRKSVAQLLLQWGAIVDAIDFDGRTAFDWAEKKNNKDVAKTLRDFATNQSLLAHPAGQPSLLFEDGDYEPFKQSWCGQGGKTETEPGTAGFAVEDGEQANELGLADDSPGHWMQGTGVDYEEESFAWFQEANRDQGESFA